MRMLGFEARGVIDEEATFSLESGSDRDRDRRENVKCVASAGRLEQSLIRKLIRRCRRRLNSTSK